MFWLLALRIGELLTLVSPVPDGKVIVIALFGERRQRRRWTTCRSSIE